MPASAMSSPVITRVHSLEDEQHDLPDAGLHDEPTNGVRSDSGKGAEISPAGTESLIPKIFPVYAFI